MFLFLWQLFLHNMRSSSMIHWIFVKEHFRTFRFWIFWRHFRTLYFEDFGFWPKKNASKRKPSMPWPSASVERGRGAKFAARGPHATRGPVTPQGPPQPRGPPRPRSQTSQRPYFANPLNSLIWTKIKPKILQPQSSHLVCCSMILSGAVWLRKLKNLFDSVHCLLTFPFALDLLHSLAGGLT